MTPDEIRALHNSEPRSALTPNRQVYEFYQDSAEFTILREIAAQLAENSALMRQDFEERRSQREENRAFQIAQQKMMEPLADASARIMAPPEMPRVEFPGT